MDSYTEAFLKARIDYSRNILDMVINYDRDVVEGVLQGDIARAEKMLAREYEEAANADHITSRGE
jgi:hypothetical protein